ncbi:hypothetical protein HZU73_09216 [Apis mellifera caucasica]|uniref:Uncharacterized protein LOC100576918 n=1 Tax=Apis mellifera TaxID=7460 RepID=A0A7M7M1A1_APIME|nr:uncharacterized protein LOC100576918 [Apis mellifera]KAG6795433.1 hypothetical protein HZU73_09216 [Apis mellifera caucasica]KAG9438226.1 hypothetical protein HZU67_01236 [Apis mellifera carnica]|eukprot:XP_016771938.1 uncharacterized protein LOC100576918 [Apis mellifera]
MDSIEKVINLLHKRRTIREEQFTIEEKKQITEYSNLINTLQAIKDERNTYKESIVKNLQSLTMHKHSIYKLIYNAENISGLPVSHDYHRQAIMFLSEGIDFINKLQDIFKNFDNIDKKNNINSMNMLHDIIFCTKSIGNELCKVKSLISDIKTLQKNTEILQEYYLVNDDEDIKI